MLLPHWFYIAMIQFSVPLDQTVKFVVMTTRRYVFIDFYLFAISVCILGYIIGFKKTIVTSYMELKICLHKGTKL